MIGGASHSYKQQQTLIKNHDPIRVDNSVQTVRNGEHSAVRKGLSDCTLNLLVRLVINRCSCFVQYQNL
jgi:hypothetical protein